MRGKGIPLKDLVPHLRGEFNRLNARLLIVDSVAKATGDDLNAQEAVSTYSNAVDQIGAKACLSIAHTTKEGGDRYAYGSIYWDAIPRLTWNVKGARLLGSKLGVLLSNRKSNDDSLQFPWAFRFAFTNNNGEFEVSVEPDDPEELEQKVKNGSDFTMADAVKDLLRNSKDGLTQPEMAQLSKGSPSNIKKICQRNPQEIIKAEQKRNGHAVYTYRDFDEPLKLGDTQGTAGDTPKKDEGTTGDKGTK